MSTRHNKVIRYMSIVMLIGLFLSFNSIIHTTDDKINITETEIIKAVLNKVVEDYKHQISSYGEKMPSKISIALVKQQFDKGDPLRFCENVKKHWLYENGSISESESSVRKTSCKKNRDYPPSFSIITFAIFCSDEKTTVQLDENWFAQNGAGALYEVIKEANGKISLKILNGLWES